MPIGGGRGGGGGGLHFRRPADSFSGADIAAARTARDTFFGAMANAAALAEFQNDDFLAIRLTVTGVAGNVFETYTGSPGDAYDNALWVERTDAIQGDRGAAGAPGGGALEHLATFDTTITATNDDMFLDAGFDWPDDTDWVMYIPINTGGGQNAGVGLWQDLDRIDAIDPSTVGTASTAATRIHANDQGIAGSVYFGRTAAGRALIEFSEANDPVAFSFYKYVPSAQQGGLTTDQVNALIAAADIQDSQIPASIMRDAEFTAAAVRTLLGLTATEVTNLFVGASISDHTITVTQNDGSTLNIAVPDDSDGVVTDATLDGTTNVLTLTLSEGNPVTVDLSGLAGSGGVSLATVLAAIRAGTGITIDRTTDNQITIAATGAPTPGDHSRRYAISADEMLSDAEAMAAETSDSQRITGPAWGTGVLRYRFIGVPENEDDISDIEQGGLSVFSAFEAYEDNNGDAIIVDGHKWWKDTHAVDGEFNSNQILTIIQ